KSSGSGSRQERVGLIEQGQRCEQSETFAVYQMQRRATTTQLCVVHRGQIVENQRTRVQEFNRARDRRRRLRVAAASHCPQQGQDRAPAFASGKDGGAQRLVQPFRSALRAERQ